MSNPIEKFKRSILHLNRSLHHCTSSRNGLSAQFKEDSALRRVDGENDYIYYAGNLKI